MSASQALPAGGLNCLLCKQPIADQYFLAGGVKPVCPVCKGRIEAVPKGPLEVAILAGAGLGLLAALGGTAIWAAWVVYTHSLWGFVAIGVGLLIGFAVKKGAGRHSGPIFQGIAMGLTVCSLAWATTAIGMVLGNRSIPTDPVRLGQWAVTAFPVYLAFLTKDPFSILFLAIALYEAWKLNRQRRLLFTGPFGKSAAIDFGRA